jgi:ethanolamine ammonia-lyase small subunit
MAMKARALTHAQATDVVRHEFSHAYTRDNYKPMLPTNMSDKAWAVWKRDKEQRMDYMALKMARGEQITDNTITEAISPTDEYTINERNYNIYKNVIKNDWNKNTQQYGQPYSILER